MNRKIRDDRASNNPTWVALSVYASAAAPANTYRVVDAHGLHLPTRRKPGMSEPALPQEADAAPLRHRRHATMTEQQSSDRIFMRIAAAAIRTRI
jgi:hypothetical protein